MFIGAVFVAKGLLTPEVIEAALGVQRERGGELGDCVVDLGKLSAPDLAAVMRAAPPSPHTIAQTGVPAPDLLNLLMKAIYTGGRDTPTAMGDFLKLPPRAIEELLEEAQERQLLNVLGASGALGTSELRYGITEKGRK